MMNQELMSRLTGCDDLPALPPAAVRIVELARDPTATMADVASTVGADPAANEKILRLANSPVYGGRRQNTNLRQAVTLLGINATLMITLSFSVFASLRAARRSGLDLDLFWRRSLLAGAAGRVLAQRASIRAAEDTFLAAMMQDIGVLALDAAVDNLYADLNASQQLDHPYMVRYEVERVGTDHAEVGRWLLARWQFPEHLGAAVESSHHPEQLADADAQPVARCVALSGLVADALIGEDGASLWPVVQAHASGYWAPGDGWLDEVFEHLGTEVPVVGSLFRMPLIDDEQAGTLVAGSKELLAGPAAPAKRPAPAQARPPREHRGILDRDDLIRLIDEEFQLAVEHHWPFSFVFVDVDRVKPLIDAHGSDTGHRALERVASVLSDTLRDSDIVGRYAEKQFIAVLPGTDAPGARIVGNRLVAAVRDAALTGRGGAPVHITVSAGLVAQTHAQSFPGSKDMLRAARRCAFKAGMEGGDRLVERGPAG